MSECRRVCIPCTNHHIGFFTLDKRDEHIRQPEECIGWFAFAVGQCPHREEGAKEQRIAIDEQEALRHGIIVRLTKRHSVECVRCTRSSADRAVAF